MKKKSIILLIAATAILALLLCACSGQGGGTVSDAPGSGSTAGTDTAPSVQPGDAADATNGQGEDTQDAATPQDPQDNEPDTAGTPDDAAKPDDTAAPDDGGDAAAQDEAARAEALAAYRTALEKLMSDKVFPNGDQAEYLDGADMSENGFAIYDIDGDGMDELIIAYTGASMAGQSFQIYGYDALTKTLNAEFYEFPTVTIFDNGVIKADWSHNQGLAGNFWPFDLYKYDAETDTFAQIGMVDAWDKTITAVGEGGKAFPDDVDVSGTGIVYYIIEGSEYKTVDPVDETDLTKWIDGYLSGAETVKPDYQPLTEENVAALK